MKTSKKPSEVTFGDKHIVQKAYTGTEHARKAPPAAACGRGQIGNVKARTETSRPKVTFCTVAEQLFFRDYDNGTLYWGGHYSVTINPRQ